MKSIEYALKVKDDFVICGWDYKYEWDDIYKDCINESNFTNALFKNYEEAYNKMNSLIADIQEFGSVDELTIDDIDDIRIVQVEMNFSYKVIEMNAK